MPFLDKFFIRPAKSATGNRLTTREIETVGGVSVESGPETHYVIQIDQTGDVGVATFRWFGSIREANILWSDEQQLWLPNPQVLDEVLVGTIDGANTVFNTENSKKILNLEDIEVDTVARPEELDLVSVFVVEAKQDVVAGFSGTSYETSTGPSGSDEEVPITFGEFFSIPAPFAPEIASDFLIEITHVDGVELLDEFLAPAPVVIESRYIESIEGAEGQITFAVNLESIFSATDVDIRVTYFTANSIDVVSADGSTGTFVLSSAPAAGTEVLGIYRTFSDDRWIGQNIPTSASPVSLDSLASVKFVSNGILDATINDYEFESYAEAWIPRINRGTFYDFVSFIPPAVDQDTIAEVRVTSQYGIPLPNAKVLDEHDDWYYNEQTDQLVFVNGLWDGDSTALVEDVEEGLVGKSLPNAPLVPTEVVQSDGSLEDKTTNLPYGTNIRVTEGPTGNEVVLDRDTHYAIDETSGTVTFIRRKDSTSKDPFDGPLDPFIQPELTVDSTAKVVSNSVQLKGAEPLKVYLDGVPLVKDRDYSFVAPNNINFNPAVFPGGVTGEVVVIYKAFRDFRVTESTGQIELFRPLFLSDELQADYEYTVDISDEVLASSAAGGEFAFDLANKSLVAGTLVVVRNGVVITDYTVQNELGFLSLDTPLIIGDSLIVSYTYKEYRQERSRILVDAVNSTVASVTLGNTKNVYPESISLFLVDSLSSKEVEVPETDYTYNATDNLIEFSVEFNPSYVPNPQDPDFTASGKTLRADFLFDGNPVSGEVVVSNATGRETVPYNVFLDKGADPTENIISNTTSLTINPTFGRFEDISSQADGSNATFQLTEFPIVSKACVTEPTNDPKFLKLFINGQQIPEETEISTRDGDSLTTSGSPDVAAKHFFIQSPSTNYYVWFQTGSDNDPATIPILTPYFIGLTGIQVTINSTDTADQVASTTATALDTHLGGTVFNASSSGNIITVENVDSGFAKDAYDGTTGFGFSVISSGGGIAAVNGTTGIVTLASPPADDDEVIIEYYFNTLEPQPIELSEYEDLVEDFTLSGDSSIELKRTRIETDLLPFAPADEDQLVLDGIEYDLEIGGILQLDNDSYEIEDFDVFGAETTIFLKSLLRRDYTAPEIRSIEDANNLTYLLTIAADINNPIGQDSVDFVLDGDLRLQFLPGSVLRFESRSLTDEFAAVAAQTLFTLSGATPILNILGSGAANDSDLIVKVDGVIQTPTADYTVDSVLGTVTLTTPAVGGETVSVTYNQSVNPIIEYNRVSAVTFDPDADQTTVSLLSTVANASGYTAINPISVSGPVVDEGNTLGILQEPLFDSLRVYKNDPLPDPPYTNEIFDFVINAEDNTYTLTTPLVFKDSIYSSYRAIRILDVEIDGNQNRLKYEWWYSSAREDIDNLEIDYVFEKPDNFYFKVMSEQRHFDHLLEENEEATEQEGAAGPGPGPISQEPSLESKGVAGPTFKVQDKTNDEFIVQRVTETFNQRVNAHEALRKLRYGFIVGTDPLSEDTAGRLTDSDDGVDNDIDNSKSLGSRLHPTDDPDFDDSSDPLDVYDVLINDNRYDGQNVAYLPVVFSEPYGTSQFSGNTGDFPVNVTLQEDLEVTLPAPTDITPFIVAKPPILNPSGQVSEDISDVVMEVDTGSGFNPYVPEGINGFTGEIYIDPPLDTGDKIRIEYRRVDDALLGLRDTLINEAYPNTDPVDANTPDNETLYLQVEDNLIEKEKGIIQSGGTLQLITKGGASLGGRELLGHYIKQSGSGLVSAILSGSDEPHVELSGTFPSQTLDTNTGYTVSITEEEEGEQKAGIIVVRMDISGTDYFADFYQFEKSTGYVDRVIGSPSVPFDSVLDLTSTGSATIPIGYKVLVESTAAPNPTVDSVFVIPVGYPGSSGAAPYDWNSSDDSSKITLTKTFDDEDDGGSPPPYSFSLTGTYNYTGSPNNVFSNGVLPFAPNTALVETFEVASTGASNFNVNNVSTNASAGLYTEGSGSFGSLYVDAQTGLMMVINNDSSVGLSMENGDRFEVEFSNIRAWSNEYVELVGLKDQASDDAAQVIVGSTTDLYLSHYDDLLPLILANLNGQITEEQKIADVTPYYLITSPPDATEESFLRIIDLNNLKTLFSAYQTLYTGWRDGALDPTSYTDGLDDRLADSELLARETAILDRQSDITDRFQVLADWEDEILAQFFNTNKEYLVGQIPTSGDPGRRFLWLNYLLHLTLGVSRQRQAQEDVIDLIGQQNALGGNAFAP
jgi:hypothetical protein